MSRNIRLDHSISAKFKGSLDQGIGHVRVTSQRQDLTGLKK
jgi:hypothetical protein